MTYSLAAVPSPLSINIVHTGFSDDVNITRWGPGKRNSYIIHYVLEGKGIFNGTPLHKGQGFLITKGTLHEYHSDAADPWTYFWIIMDGEEAWMEQCFSLNICSRTAKKLSLVQLISLIRNLKNLWIR